MPSDNLETLWAFQEKVESSLLKFWKSNCIVFPYQCDLQRLNLEEWLKGTWYGRDSRVANPTKFFRVRFAHFLGEISIFLVRWHATCQLRQATFFVFNIKRLHTWICCPFPLIIITSTVKCFLLNELLCWNLLQTMGYILYIYIYIIIHFLYMYVQTIYWQDFHSRFSWDSLDFRESVRLS